MRKKTIASRIMYKVYIIAHIVSLLSFTIVFFVVFENGAFEATIALAIFNAVNVVHFFFYIQKAVWVVMDEDIVHIGNFFFKKKVSVRDIASYNTFLLIPNFYRIKIESEKYYFVSYLNQKSIKDLLTVSEKQ